MRSVVSLGKEKKWKGLLVEPNPSIFEKLVRNHEKSESNLFFEKCAIGEVGEFTLYWYVEETWMASLNKEHVINQMKGENYKILEEKIKVISFSDLLLRNESFSNVNILVIDTEGWDAKIVQSINFECFKSDMIVFESAHIEDEEFDKTIQYLSKNNYKCFTSRVDTTAINKNTELKELQNILMNHKNL